MTSPALEAEPRTREKAALDHARWVLGQIAGNCHEAETVKFVREQIAHITDILTA